MALQRQSESLEPLPPLYQHGRASADAGEEELQLPKLLVRLPLPLCERRYRIQSPLQLL